MPGQELAVADGLSRFNKFMMLPSFPLFLAKSLELFDSSASDVSLLRVGMSLREIRAHWVMDLIGICEWYPKRTQIQLIRHTFLPSLWLQYVPISKCSLVFDCKNNTFFIASGRLGYLSFFFLKLLVLPLQQRPQHKS